MKRIGFVLVLLTLTTLASRAQNDDMYFVPKKSNSFLKWVGIFVSFTVRSSLPDIHQV